MEEEETKEYKETSGTVDESVGNSYKEQVSTSGGNSDNLGSNNVGVGSEVSVAVNNDPEHPTLKNVVKSIDDFQECQATLSQSWSAESLRQSSNASEENFEAEFGKAQTSGFDSPAASDVFHDCNSPTAVHIDTHSLHHLKKSSSATSLDSPLYTADGVYSPFYSSLRPRLKPTTPNVSPELLHLVDSAIMGKPESMESLKNIVRGVESFGNGEEPESVAYLIVDSLIATMGGVESLEEDEDDNPPSVMLNSRAAIVAAELIPWLPWIGDLEGLMSPRTRMVRGLLAILRACTRNRAMCCAAGLFGVLLQSTETIFIEEGNSTDQQKWNGIPLCSCIQYLGGHSLSVIDLQKWFQLIRKTLTTNWASILTISLEKALEGKESRGPACTFELDGESSGLLGPGESRWPFTTGYAFATWVYIESFADTLNTAAAAAAIAAAAAAKSGKSSAMSAAAAASALAGDGTAHMPRLFSFLSSDNQGMEAYFHSQFLVVESGCGKGKKASLHFTHAFKPQCWYFVGLEHTCKQGLIGKSEGELRLYIDGTLCESRPFEFPRISRPLAFCCIGTNPPPTMAGLQRRRVQCPLFAEMGPIYIFKEPIGPDRMARLASRGGDELPSFGIGAGLPWMATNEHVQNMAEESALLDAEIGGFLHLLYHPRLLSGRFCPDASPSGATGMLRRPAEILGQVHVATRMRPAEALWALAYGGPMSLLPLAVSNIQENTLEPQQGNLSLSLSTATLAAPIIRIISLAIQHPGNNEELCRIRGPEILSRILNYLLQTLSSRDVSKHGPAEEELVAAIVSLCQSQKNNYALKVHLFSTLLLDLKIWSLCSYGLQKKLLSSLADMVFTESSVMRDANAIQMLLDGCRRCYWTIQENDSINTFSMTEATRPVGEVNALVDELLVVIELLVVAASPSLAVDDVRCLLGFMVDCPQPNQVARVLHLIYRLVVQPNSSRAHTFAEAFLSGGGIETLLVLLQHEAKVGDHDEPDPSLESIELLSLRGSAENNGDNVGFTFEKELNLHDKALEPQDSRFSSFDRMSNFDRFSSFDRFSNIERMSTTSDRFTKTLGGIGFSITAHNARNNAYNVDNSDGIIVGIIGLLGALVVSGHLKFGSHASPDATGNLLGLVDGGGTMFDDKVSLLLFSLQKAFQAAPNRLLTRNVYRALIGASGSGINEVGVFGEEGLFFELGPFLALHCSTVDLLFLACSHAENRSSLIQMEEWPEWILEVLISNYEMGASKTSNPLILRDVEDLIHGFLIIMLEHSMRKKDGWKDIEATIHCAEWLCMVGGSSTGDQRVRREQSLPIFKRRLLGELLDFSTSELQVQTQVIAAAAAGVAAEGLAPEVAKAEAENAAQLSVALVENAIVILMLVEDHLRLQSKLYSASHFPDSSPSPLSYVLPVGNSSNMLSIPGEPFGSVGDGNSTSGDSGRLSFDVLASMADAKGQLSAAVMERLAAAAAAEPYASVSCAFVSYGTCVMDLADGWKYRSRLWYGVGLPSKITSFGGGGSGWESWRSAVEKDENGYWVERPLIKKSVSMLQALLLDESGLGGGLGIGGGSGTGMGGMTALYQLLDSDQPFFCMLRMVLVSMREEDDGEENNMKNVNGDDWLSEGLHQQDSNMSSVDNYDRISTRNPQSALLRSVLSPILNMPVSESKRQRVLVASSVLYSEVWHAVGRDRNPIRKKYLEAILPPFVGVLRRWRPLLAGIHELTTPDCSNPLVVDDPALAADALPIEENKACEGAYKLHKREYNLVPMDQTYIISSGRIFAAVAMVSPSWAAAFASPPAAMALAMVAAGAAGGETPAAPPKPVQLKRDSSLLERKTVKLHTFSSFQKPLEASSSEQQPASPKDKALAKAAALAAARDLERNAKIGSGRGLSAVAMATSSQRRSTSDNERVRRWNLSESMGTAWTECLQSVDSRSVYGKDFNALSYKFIAVLVGSLALARNIQRSEVDRRMQVDAITQHRLVTGVRAWRKLIHYLVEMKCLFGPFDEQLNNPKRVFWKLDCMESSSRMRRCVRRNYRGSDHLGAAADYEDRKELKHDQETAISPSKASIFGMEAISMDLVNEDDDHEGIVNLEGRSDGVDQLEDIETRLLGIGEQPVQTPVESRDPQVTSNQEFMQNSLVVAPGYVPYKNDEIILLELPASMVRPLRVLRGMFQITTKRIGFIVDKGENSASTTENRYQAKDHNWLLSSLHQIYSRRVFFASVSEALSIMQYPVFPWILSDYTSKTLDLTNPSSYRDLSKVVFIFEHFIFTVSPIPYVAAFFRLNHMALYNLQPIGALTADRLKKFQERYSSFNDPVIPKFHYGSHYSSAGIVLYYLMRVEPFTTLSIHLQGGKFDHADRMFSDMASTWNGVLEDMSDVKELVPELFYMPEVLSNENSIEFDTTQIGEKLDSVKLPPWAENPVDFIHKHRMALESEHISAHLHEWIDLIFGYKQRGKEAISANNVFFYVTYEGTVDIDKISDPVQQRATQDQIAYFGQTPSQLLTVPHLKKLPLADVLRLQTIFQNPKEIKPYVVPSPERCNLPAAAIHASSESLVIVDIDAPAAHIAQHKWQPNTPDGQGMPFLFHHGKESAISTGGNGTLIRMFKGSNEPEEWHYPQALAYAASGVRCSAIVSITCDKEIITGKY
ncbi:hypothetical protein LguiA_019183 [Lonicera macranthoides]